jgi:hypothetical protein
MQNAQENFRSGMKELGGEDVEEGLTWVEVHISDRTGEA